MVSAADTNLISNPSLEDATNSLPVDWNSGSWGDNDSTHNYQTEAAQDGTSSVTTSITRYVDGDAKWYFSPVSVTAGSQYNYTEYYRSDVATRLVVAFINAEGSYSYLDLPNAAASPSDWKFYTASFAVPEGIQTATVYHLLDSVGSLSIDNVSLSAVTAPVVTPWTGNIPNGSLENADPANPNKPASWTGAAWGENTPTYEWLNEGHDGSKSVKVTVDNYVSGDAKWIFTSLPTGTSSGQLRRGQQYSFSAWYKTNTIPNAVVHFVRDDNTDAYYGMPNPQPNGSDWQLYKDTFTVPVDVKSVDVFFYLNSNGWIQTDSYEISEYSPSGFNRPLVSLTFDDGHEDNVANALPMLNSYGFKSTQCYMTGMAGETTAEHDSHDDGVLEGNTAGQAGLVAFYEAGHEICSHTVSHRDLRTLSTEDLRFELGHSQEVLEQILANAGYPGVKVRNFASPYGGYNAAANTIVDDYYRSHRTVDEGFNSKDNFDIYRLRVQNIQNTTTMAEFQSWIDQAKATNTWLILVYHRVAADAGQFDVYPDEFAKQLASISASGMTVKTTQDALDEVLPQLPGSETPEDPDTDPEEPPVIYKTGDVNTDGVVNFADLAVVLSKWTQTGANLTGDVNTDGVVNFADLAVILSQWGQKSSN